MATTRISLIEQLRKTQVEGDVDFLREAARLTAQMLIDYEADQAIGAEPYERSPLRRTYRNGHRVRRWDTRVGTITLKVPKLRQGSFFPSLIKPRRRTEREAYIHGVSTRKVDELVQALGMTGISRSAVSRVCKELDELVRALRNRPLVEDYPYLWQGS